MRVTYSRLWRGFRELDGLTARQADALIESVRQETGNRLIRVPLGAALVIACMCFCVMFFLTFKVELFGLPEASVWLAVLLSISVASFLGPLAGFVVRDQVLRVGLRRRIDQARCRKCAYLLIGLRAVNDVLRCPECGTVVSLAECLGVELRSAAPGRREEDPA